MTFGWSYIKDKASKTLRYAKNIGGSGVVFVLGASTLAVVTTVKKGKKAFQCRNVRRKINN